MEEEKIKAFLLGCPKNWWRWMYMDMQLWPIAHNCQEFQLGKMEDNRTRQYGYISLIKIKLY